MYLKKMHSDVSRMYQYECKIKQPKCFFGLMDACFSSPLLPLDFPPPENISNGLISARPKHGV